MRGISVFKEDTSLLLECLTYLFFLIPCTSQWDVLYLFPNRRVRIISIFFIPWVVKFSWRDPHQRLHLPPRDVELRCHCVSVRASFMARWLNYKERWREVLFSVFHFAPGISSLLADFISLSKQLHLAHVFNKIRVQYPSISMVCIFVIFSIYFGMQIH